MDIAQLLIREAVRDTIAHYGFAGDRGHLGELADCFTATGRLVIAGREPMVGPSGIVAGLSSTLGADPDTAAKRTHVHHSVTNVHFISVRPERVEASAYFAVRTPIGLDHWGRYRDTLVPEGDRWLFEERRVTTDGYAPGSLFAR